MAQKFLTNLDLNKNELQNAKIQNLGTAPSSPADGQIYFDTSDDALKVYDGTQWINLQEGDISGVTAGTGLSGGGSSGAITIDIANTGVGSGSYGSATAIPVLQVNAQGQITSASTSAISTTLDLAADSGVDDGVLLGTDTLTISGGTGLSSSVTGDTITVKLDDTTVSSGSYGSATLVPVLQINAQGQITSATTAAISTTLDIAADSGLDDGVLLGTDTLTISGGTGLSSSVTGDTITVTLNDTAVGAGAGAHGSATSVATFTVDAQGRLTAAGSTAIAIPHSQVTDFDEAVEDVVAAQLVTNGTHSGITASYDDAGDGAIDLSLATSGVTAATYGDADSVAQVTVDAQGRVTSAQNVDISIASSQGGWLAVLRVGASGAACWSRCCS